MYYCIITETKIQRYRHLIFKVQNDIINISRDGELKSINKISTGYYPDFPTDLQSLMLYIDTSG